jgi:DNA-binding transcriptional LysR family regulator
MDRFDQLQLFTRIVELRSFSRAAAALDLPRATATHAIKELEARLATRLLERTTRQVRPTLDGQAYYERCVQILAELDDAESTLRQVARNPRGVLRVDLHGTHASRVVLPRIDEFHERYPGIELIVGSGDRLVDLIGEGVDCVVRGGDPRDSSLVARRLVVLPQIICASPAYLARHGLPRHPDALAQHQVVKFLSRGGHADAALDLIIDGQRRSIGCGGWLTVNDAENYVVAALRGCGLIQLPRFHIEDELSSGRLVPVLADWTCPGMPISALYPQHRQLSPRVRVFIDWLTALYAERFGALDAATAAST